MAVYTVTISSAGSPDIVSLTDGSTYAVLEVSAGRGPKGDGFTGGTYNASTGVVTFTSNDGIGFSTGDLRGDLSEPGPIGDVTPNTGAFTSLTATTADINGGTIDGTVIGGTTPAAISGTTGDFSGDLTVDTDTLYVDSANNRVGIGTSSPSQILTVNGERAQFNQTLVGVSTPLQIRNGSATTNGRGAGVEFVGPSNTFGRIEGFWAGTDETVRLFSTGSTRFHTAGSERMRIDSSGNVGIGTSSPASDAKLHVDGTNTVLLITEDSEGEATLRFGDTQGDLSQSFAISYNTGGTNETFFKRNNTTVGRWVSEGFVVGQSNAASPFTLITANNDATKAGAALRETGYLAAARYQAEAMFLNRMNNDGDIVQFRKDGTAVGSIGAHVGDIYIASATDALKIDDNVRPASITGAANDAAMDLGTSGSRFKDLYLSGAVYLGGTSSANALDDYEEGTWTPTLPNGGTIGNIVAATYTKVGKIVHAQGYIQTINPTANTSVFEIGGLPFTVNPTTGAYEVGSIGYTRLGDLSNLSLGAQIYETYLYFHHIDGTTSVRLTNNNWISRAGGEHLIFSITYQTS